MSGSFFREKPTPGSTLSAWRMSRAAMDVVANMGEAINEMTRARTTLVDYPADAAERVAARAAARQFIDYCDELERLQGPSPVVSIETFRRPQ